MLIDIINPLKESHNHRNNKKAEKNQRENSQIFPDYIAVQDIGKSEGKTRQVPRKLFPLGGGDAFFISAMRDTRPGFLSAALNLPG